MPARNRAAYIGEAIESVLRQTFTDWELVIVDDGSTDDTVKVAERYGDKRIRLYPIPGARRAEWIAQDAREWKWEGLTSGEGTARNIGLRLSRGDLYACLDSDDVWEPWHLARGVARLDARPDLALTSGSPIKIDAMGRVIRNPWCAVGRSARRMDRQIWLVCGIMHSGVVARMVAVMDRDGYSPMAYATDWDLWQRMVFRGDAIEKRGEYTYRLRDHGVQTRAAEDYLTRAVTESVCFERGLRVLCIDLPAEQREALIDRYGIRAGNQLAHWQHSVKALERIARVPGMRTPAAIDAFMRWQHKRGRVSVYRGLDSLRNADLITGLPFVAAARSWAGYMAAKRRLER